jgi:hypothetical protein
VAIAGAGTYFSTLVVTSIDKAEVREDGGDVVAITGQFLDAEHTVSILTPSGEVPCYLGSSGNGESNRPVSPTCLVFVSPPLPLGTDYALIVRTGAQDATLRPAFNTRNRSFGASQLAVRQTLPPVLKLGPRNLDVTDPLTTVPINASTSPVDPGVYALLGLNFNHTSTIDGTLYTRSANYIRGDPMFLKMRDGAIEWVVHWTMGVHDGSTAANAYGGPLSVKLLDDGGAVVSAAFQVLRSGGTQQQVQINNADGTLFKEFDTLNALDEDRIGIGNNGFTNNCVIARYDIDGQCLWAKRFGPNADFFQGWINPSSGQAQGLRVDATRNTVCHGFVYQVSGGLGQHIVAGLGEANELDQAVSNTGHSSFDLEFDLDDGTLQPRQIVDVGSGTNLSNWSYARNGVIGGSGQYMGEGYVLAGSIAGNGTWDLLGPAPLVNAIPWTSPYKYSHAITKYDDVSAGPDWTVYANLAAGATLVVPVGNSSMVRSATHFYAVTHMPGTLAASLLLTSAETGLSVAQALTTSLQAPNAVVWKLNLDGLTDFDFSVIHKLDVAAVGVTASFRMLDVANGVLLAYGFTPQNNTYTVRFGVGETNQTDVVYTKARSGDLLSFYDETNMEFMSAIVNFNTTSQLPQGEGGAFGAPLSDTEFLTLVSVTTGIQTKLDDGGADVLPPLPSGSQDGYFGYAIWDTSTQSFVSWSGEVFGISNATSPAAFTYPSALDARRFT